MNKPKASNTGAVHKAFNPLGLLRTAKGLTQAELGLRIIGREVKYQNEYQIRVSDIETGRRMIREDEAQTMAEILGTSPTTIHELSSQAYTAWRMRKGIKIMGNETITAAAVVAGKRKVEGRELEQLVACCIFNMAGKINEAVKVAEVDVFHQLSANGYAASPVSIRGAIVSLMKSRRLTVVRDCLGETGTRIYRTSDKLRDFAGIAELSSETKGSDEPKVSDETKSQPSPALKTAIQTLVSPPAAAGRNEDIRDDTRNDTEVTNDTITPAMAQRFDDLMLDLLARAATAKDAQTENKLSSVARQNLEARIEHLELERMAATETISALQAQVSADRATVTGRDKHELKKCAYILRQVLGQLENPMLAAMFGAVNIKAEGLNEVLFTVDKLAE